MLDGWHDGELAGSGMAIWRSRRRLAAGEIDEEEFMETALASAPSVGHCNTMGTASTMNAMAEALGMSLTGCAAIPGAYRERGQMAYRTGRRAVELGDRRHQAVRRPHAVRPSSMPSGSIRRSAAPPMRNRIWPPWRSMPASIFTPMTGRCMGSTFRCSPTCSRRALYLGERFHRAGGVPAVMWELLQAGKLDGDCPTVTGKTMAENLKAGKRRTARSSAPSPSR